MILIYYYYIALLITDDYNYYRLQLYVIKKAHTCDRRLQHRGVRRRRQPDCCWVRIDLRADVGKSIYGLRDRFSADQGSYLLDGLDHLQARNHAS